jgi:molybdenum cofactor cytidylyltransferase
MQLSKALRLSTHPLNIRASDSSVIGFVGAGGKTTAMFRAAQELAPALVTTTTHLGAWQASLANVQFAWGPDEPMPDMESVLGASIVLVTGPLDEETERYRGLTPPQLEKLRQLAGYHDLPLLIEADGSRQKPFKAPAEHEPVIPEFAQTVVVVAGLSGLGKPLTEENIHRAQRFAELSGLKMGEPVTADGLINVLTHPGGGLKNIPVGARRVALLNQTDTPLLQSQAHEIAQALLSAYDSVVITALDSPQGLLQEPVIAVKENIAGIILAGGKSSRFGKAKQLLDYHGQPFVRVVAETALKAGLSPVILVSGANSEKVEAAVKGLPIKVVHNPDWENGQSTSIRAGLLECGSSLAWTPGRATSSFAEAELRHSKQVGGAIFLLADQPQVSVEVLRALVERHSQDLPAALAPYVFDQRANPVLFDQITFSDLLALQGDTGGRAIFSKFSPRYLNWYDKRLLLDVDTPEDYQKLLDEEP